MAKPEWGTKRSCASCGAPFYDLNKDPIICPKCGVQFMPDAVLKPRRKGPEDKPVPVKKAPVKKIVDEDAELADEEVEDEELLDDAEVEDDDADVGEVIDAPADKEPGDS